MKVIWKFPSTGYGLFLIVKGKLVIICLWQWKLLCFSLSDSAVCSAEPWPGERTSSSTTRKHWSFMFLQRYKQGMLKKGVNLWIIFTGRFSIKATSHFYAFFRIQQYDLVWSDSLNNKWISVAVLPQIPSRLWKLSHLNAPIRVGSSSFPSYTGQYSHLIYPVDGGYWCPSCPSYTKIIKVFHSEWSDFL